MPGEDAGISLYKRATTATATSTADKSIGDRAISKKATGEGPKSNDEDSKRDTALNAAVQRLSKVADFAYGKSQSPKPKMKRINLDPDSEQNTPFRAVLINAYQRLSTDVTRQMYLADLAVLMPAIEEAGRRWLQLTLIRNLQTLDKLSHELLTPDFISILHRDARKYFDVLNSMPKVPVSPVAKGIPAKLGHTDEQRLSALRLVQNEWLQFLYNYSGGLYPGSRLYAIADSEQAAKRVILKVIDEAGKAIIEFGKSVVESPDHVWRFQPIVIGAAIDLKISDDPYFVRFLLDVAKLRSASPLDEVLLIAGIAITTVALVATGPGAAVVLGLIEIGVGGLAAYEQHEWDLENDLAELSSVFGQGEGLTNRPTDPLAYPLAVAAALLGAVPTMQGFVGLRRGFQTKRLSSIAEKTKKAAVPRTGPKGRAEIRGASAELGGQPKASGLQEGPLADKGIGGSRVSSKERALEKVTETHPPSNAVRGTSDKAVSRGTQQTGTKPEKPAPRKSEQKTSPKRKDLPPTPPEDFPWKLDKDGLPKQRFGKHKVGNPFKTLEEALGKQNEMIKQRINAFREEMKKKGKVLGTDKEILEMKVKGRYVVKMPNVLEVRIVDSKTGRTVYSWLEVSEGGKVMNLGHTEMKMATRIDFEKLNSMGYELELRSTHTSCEGDNSCSTILASIAEKFDIDITLRYITGTKKGGTRLFGKGFNPPGPDELVE